MVETTTVQTWDELHRLADQLDGWAQDGQWISVDLETRSDVSNFEDWHDSSRIVSVSFSPSAQRSWVVPLSHPAARAWHHDWQRAGGALFEPLQQAKLIAQNGKFDIRWIYSTTGVDLSDALAWDTQAAGFLIDENASHRLEDMAVANLGVPPWKADVDLKDAEREEWTRLARYNALDTAYTFALADWQREQLKVKPELGRVMWYILMPVIRSLVHIERSGLLLDEEETKRRLAEAVADRDRLYQEFEDQIPAKLVVKHGIGHPRLFDVGAPTPKERVSLAPTSKFFQEYAGKWPVVKCTEQCKQCSKKGTRKHPQPSWDEEAMKRLVKLGHDDAAKLLEYRSVDRQITSFLSRWPNDVHSDGRIRATYNAATARTGRLVCSDPNIQQIDRRLKGCWVSPPGWRFVQVDHSQIELRLGAIVSGDANLVRAYQEGRDIHRLTASAVTGKPEHEVEDEERYNAKAVNFGFLFGQLAPGFRDYAFSEYGLELTMEEAERMRDRFFGLYPGLLEYHEKMRRQVRVKKYVTSPFGRVRRLPDISSRDQGRRWAAERQAINHPIQSGASDLMMLGLIAVTDFSRWHAGVQVVGTVHDSLLLEVREDCLEEVLDSVGRLMLDPPDLSRFPIDVTVPLEVGFEIGSRWGESIHSVSMRGRPGEHPQRLPDAA